MERTLLFLPHFKFLAEPSGAFISACFGLGFQNGSQSCAEANKITGQPSATSLNQRNEVLLCCFGKGLACPKERSRHVGPVIYVREETTRFQS